MPRDPFRAMRWQLIGFYLTGSLLFMGTLAASAIYYYSTAVTMIASTLPETKKDRQAPLEAKKPPTKSVPNPPESQATKPKDNSEKILPKKSVPPVPETITVEPREMVPKIVPDKVGPPAPDPKQVKPKDVPKEIVP